MARHTDCPGESSGDRADWGNSGRGPARNESGNDPVAREVAVLAGTFGDAHFSSGLFASTRADKGGRPG